MVISLVMLALEAGLAAALILIMQDEGLPLTFQATGPAIALVRGARLRLDHQIAAAASASSARRCPAGAGHLSGRAAAGVVVGAPARLFCPDLLQLIVGVPAILAAFGAVLWTKGFGPEDRELFRMQQGGCRGAARAEEAAQARDADRATISSSG